MQETWVWYLVRELRSRILQGDSAHTQKLLNPSVLEPTHHNQDPAQPPLLSKKKNKKKNRRTTFTFSAYVGSGVRTMLIVKQRDFLLPFFFFYFYKIKPEPQCPILASQSMGVDCGFCCGTWAAPVTGRTSHLQPHVPVAFASGPWWVGCCSRIWGQPGQNQASLMAQRVKSLPANAGDLGSIPGSGRFPGEGNGYPLQYSCLENPMDRGVYGLQFMG